MRRPLALFFAATSAAAFSTAGEGFVKAETRHFVHHARQAVPGKRAQERESFVGALQAQLSVSLRRRIDFFAYEKTQEVEAAVGRPLAGYYSHERGQIHAAPEAEDHEIVHAVAYELGDPGLLFHEGLAVALGNRGRLGGRKVDQVAKLVLRRFDPETAVRAAGRDQSFEGSAVAGSFVAWLVNTRGLDRVVAFFRASGRRGEPTAFEATFGCTLDEAAAEWGRSLGVDAKPRLTAMAAHRTAGP